MWGNVQPYVASYYRTKNKSLESDQTLLTLPVAVMFMSIGLYFGNLALVKLSPRM